MDRNWTCNTCSFAYNPLSISECDICGACPTLAIINDADPLLENDIWICEECTLANPKELANCIGCNLQCKTWTCGECTYTNSDIDSFCCAVCTNKRIVAGKNSRLCLTDIISKRYNPSMVLQAKYFQRQSELIEDLRLAEEEDALSNWLHIVKYCKENNMPFVDDSFPPIPKSLYCDGIVPPKSYVAQWLRPHELVLSSSEDAYCEMPWTIFSNPSSKDITQGALGNCWLISALAIVAEHENLLRKIMVTREYCPEGVYLIRLCKGGRWVTVMVDDLLPCDKYGRLVYSRTKKKQLWVPLIEKAIAKLYGSYDALHGGQTIDGLIMLTGQPCCIIPLHRSLLRSDDEWDEDLVWAQLLSSRHSKFLMSASTHPKDFIGENNGLSGSHAYSVLNVQDVDEHRLLQMRDPWGCSLWNGDWSTKSDKWTPKLKQYLMPHKLPDGVFWISFDDLLNVIDICKIYESGWSEIRLCGLLPPLACVKNSSCLLLTVLEPTEVEISLFQESCRNHVHSQQSQLDLCIVVFRATAQDSIQTGTLIDHSEHKVDNFIGLNKMLESHVYFLVCLAFNHWSTGIKNPENYPQYMMAVHSSKQLLVEHITPPAYMLADTLINLLLTKGRRTEECENIISYFSPKSYAGLVVMIENRCIRHFVHVKCDCEESYNLVSTRGALSTVDVIPSHHRQVIIVLSQLERSSGYRCIPTMSFQLSNQAHIDERMSHLPEIDEGVEGLHSPRPII